MLLSAVMVTACSAALVARADEPDYKKMYEELKQRVEALEAKTGGTNATVVTSPSVPQETLDFLNQVKLSGYVSASYIYDFSKGAAGGVPSTVAGRLYDSHNNQFTPDKFKLTLEKPVDFSPDKWNAGFRADVIAGKDAEVIHSTGLFGGQSFDLEQAYVKFNVPVGNGLTVLFGKHVTMLGVEVVEEVANPNWSIGNQFMFVENTTQTGLQLDYKWNDKMDTKFCLINGWDQVTDVNASKSFMGQINYTVNPDTSLALTGYGGCEEPHDNRDYRTGAEVVFNRNKLFTDKLNSWVQLDYGHEDHAPLADGSGTTTANADWYAAGLWLTYDFTDKVGLAFRTDYLRDKDGVRTPNNGAPDSPVTAPATFSVAPKELYSETLTLNYKPLPSLQVRPELRYDRAAAKGAFNGKKDQFTVSCGVAYLY